MKKNDFIVVGSLTIILMGIWLFRSINAVERRVKDFLGDSTLKFESVKKIPGGREPEYAASVHYDLSRAHHFCESLGLFELKEISDISDRNITGKMSATFGKNLVIQPNAAFYVGTLKKFPSFYTEAMVSNGKIYFIFSRY